mmetsp:Transcript_44344/g.117149  ORF Transcript_44344/g.117149 Transcript_44344/m.117149 type:complete len:252 (+) Transcript_44344:630-1385(+)
MPQGIFVRAACSALASPSSRSLVSRKKVDQQRGVTGEQLFALDHFSGVKLGFQQLSIFHKDLPEPAIERKIDIIVAKWIGQGSRQLPQPLENHLDKEEDHRGKISLRGSEDISPDHQIHAHHECQNMEILKRHRQRQSVNHLGLDSSDKESLVKERRYHIVTIHEIRHPVAHRLKSEIQEKGRISGTSVLPQISQCVDFVQSDQAKPPNLVHLRLRHNAPACFLEKEAEHRAHHVSESPPGVPLGLDSGSE